MTFPSVIAVQQRATAVPTRLSMFWIWSLRTLASLSLWALLGSQPLQAQNVLQFRDVEAYVAGTFVNQGQHHQSTYTIKALTAWGAQANG